MKVIILIIGLIIGSGIYAETKILECNFENKALEKSCPNTTITNKISITLDTDLLNSRDVPVEYEYWDCVNGSKTIQRLKLVVTPTTLSLPDALCIGSSCFDWNIDRKTLKAGWRDQRFTVCELVEIDTSDNIL